MVSLVTSHAIAVLLVAHHVVNTAEAEAEVVVAVMVVVRAAAVAAAAVAAATTADRTVTSHVTAPAALARVVVGNRAKAAAAVAAAVAVTTADRKAIYHVIAPRAVRLPAVVIVAATNAASLVTSRATALRRPIEWRGWITKQSG